MTNFILPSVNKHRFFFLFPSVDGLDIPGNGFSYLIFALLRNELRIHFWETNNSVPLSHHQSGIHSHAVFIVPFTPITTHSCSNAQRDSLQNPPWEILPPCLRMEHVSLEGYRDAGKKLFVLS